MPPPPNQQTGTVFDDLDQQEAVRGTVFDGLDTGTGNVPPGQPLTSVQKQVGQPPTWSERAAGAATGTAQGTSNLIQGFGARSIVNPLVGAYDWLRKGIPALPAPPKWAEESREAPSGTMGTIGGVAGDVAPYVAGDALAAAPFVEGAVDTAKALKYGPEVQKGARLLARSAAEGTVGGTVAGMESGGDPHAIQVGATIGSAVPPVTEGLKSLWGPLTDWWGKMTGQGGEVLRTIAADADKNFRRAMTDPAAERGLIDRTLGALKKVEQKRAADYRQSFSQLDQSIRLNLSPTEQVALQEIPKFGGTLTQVNPMQALVQRGSALVLDPEVIQIGGNYYKLGFANSRLQASVNASSRDQIREVLNHILTWQDQSPAGMDQLKQLIYDIGDKADNRVAPLFYRLGESVRDNLNQNVPGYREMTANYEKASDILKYVRQELSAGSEYGKAKNPGAMIRKLSYALNQHNDYRQLMLEMLDAAADSHLKQDVAGYSSRKWMPRGLQGTLATTPAGIAAGVGYFFHHPLAGLYMAPTAALSSPRVTANLIALIAEMGRTVPTGAGTGLTTGVGTRVVAPPAPPPPPR